MNYLIPVVLLFTAGLFGAPRALAGFAAERLSPGPRPAFEVVGYTAVTQLGGGVADAVQGFGHRVPLPQAMRMLLPEGWSYAPGTAVGNAEVSWTAGQTWLEVLAHIGEVYRLRFLIDWANKSVFAERARGESLNVPAARPVTVEHAVAEVLLWELERGGLRAQLQRWAQRANYALHWPEDIADIGIQVPASLHGDFLQAVQQVGEALEDVRAGVRVRVYPENRALVIQEY